MSLSRREITLFTCGARPQRGSALVGAHLGGEAEAVERRVRPAGAEVALELDRVDQGEDLLLALRVDGPAHGQVPPDVVVPPRGRGHDAVDKGEAKSRENDPKHGIHRDFYSFVESD